MSLTDKQEAVFAALDAGGGPNAREEADATPLYAAAKSKFGLSNPSVVKVLIAGGANPNAGAEFGFTPLHLAAIAEAESLVIEALITGGANPNARHKAVFGSLDGFTPLDIAIGRDNLPVIETLIAGGANPNARNLQDITPLHLAAKETTNRLVVVALLEAGADPKARDTDGRFPFDYAKDNKALQGTDVYWRLNEARFQ